MYQQCKSDIIKRFNKKFKSFHTPRKSISVLCLMFRYNNVSNFCDGQTSGDNWWSVVKKYLLFHINVILFLSFSDLLVTNGAKDRYCWTTYLPHYLLYA